MPRSAPLTPATNSVVSPRAFKFDTRQGADTWTSAITSDYGSGTAYALGAALTVTTSDSKNGSWQYSTTTTNSFAWWDGAVQSSVAFAKTNQSTYTTSYSYGGSGQLASIYVADGRPRTITYTTDMLGQVIRRDEADNNYSGTYSGDPHEVWYRFNGRQIAFTGNNGTLDTDYASSIAARTKVPVGTYAFRHGDWNGPAVTDYDPSLEHINSYSQGAAGGGYVVRADTFDGVRYDQPLLFGLRGAKGKIGSRMFSLTRFVGGLMLVGLFSSQASCMEHDIGGKTAAEVFPTPEVSQLARAACDGDQSGVERALKAGADPNARGYEAISPLHWAVDCANSIGVEALLKAGADPNYTPKGAFSPTYEAAGLSNSAILPILLRHGGDPNAENQANGRSALDVAMSLGIHHERWDNYYALLKAGADINRADFNQTIATKAAALGQFDKLVELLEMGYDHDLLFLARMVQTRVVEADSPQGQWRRQVMEMLEARGIEFPVPPPARPTMTTMNSVNSEDEP